MVEADRPARTDVPRIRVDVCTPLNTVSDVVIVVPEGAFGHVMVTGSVMSVTLHTTVTSSLGSTHLSVVSSSAGIGMRHMQHFQIWDCEM